MSTGCQSRTTGRPSDSLRPYRNRSSGLPGCLRAAAHPGSAVRHWLWATAIVAIHERLAARREANCQGVDEHQKEARDQPERDPDDHAEQQQPRAADLYGWGWLGEHRASVTACGA